MKDESIEVELLHAIIKRENNTRYLVKYGNEYSTILIPTKTSVKKADFDEGTKGEENKSKIEGYLLNYRMSLIKPHMEEYKGKRLGIEEKGKYNGKEYSHILPETEKEKNLIDAECGYFESLKKELGKIKAHQGFSHLNSSQAFALNFFVPMIKENKLDEFLDFPHATILQNDKETCFEKILPTFDKDNLKEETNFDVCFKTEQNKYITFEVKYSEENFGKAEEDENHNKKYTDIYKSALEILIGKEPVDDFKEKFFKQYQLWRNLIYTTKDCDVCFVFPKFRTDLTTEVKAAKALCKEEYQTKIHIFYVDDFIENLDKNEEKLKKYYEEFKIKYLDLESEVQEIKK